MDYRKKLENFWFYYKKHLLIALAVLLVLGYLTVQQLGTAEPDYHIGLVREIPCTEEALQSLKDRFTAAGTDVNGDGQVLVQLHTYYVDLAGDAPDAEVVQLLDADLIGNVSGIFLLEDVDTFQRITNNLLSGSVAVLESRLSLAVRKNASDAYISLVDNLSYTAP